MTKVTDAYGHATRYEYSPTGQLTKVTDALGNETAYLYDPCDRLTEIRQYGEETGKDKDLLRAEERNRESRICHVTRYERNLLGQVETITDALGQTERYTYDAKGQLIEKLDKEGYLTKYGYTAQGDVNRIAYADGREVKLSYNPLRQLEEMEDWLGITRIENDAAGRALKVQYPDGKEVSYTYGKSGERTGITYPDGKRAEYLYDGELRLSGLRDGNGTITYGYDEKGRLSRKSFPNGMETTYAYNGAGLLSELLHRDKEGILDRYRYQYDLTGNKTAIEKQRRGLPEESGLYAYGYDALGRLNSVAKDGQDVRSYGYDAFGNRSLLKEGSRETSYVYNALNQLVSRADALQEETYTYDKRGNLSLITADGALKNRYTYGAINRLEQAENGEGEAASYTYNGLGHRVGRMTGPETKIQYTIDLTKSYHNLLQKEEGGDVQTYLWDGNIAGIAGDNGRSGRYYLKDELGSPIRLLSESGEPEESYGYDEFGQDLYGNQGVTQPFGYTGYQADRTAGTYYAQAREYKAELGRFGAVDKYLGILFYPYDINKYTYCYNSPLRYLDRTGNVSEEEAQNIIKENSEYIIKYAEIYDVDPQIVAGCIYVEQITNVDWKDSFDSAIAIVTGLDTSIGIGQVKVSTAKLLEDEGYVEKTEGRKWYEYLFSGINRNDKIAMKLENNEKNISYVAAYLSRQIDVWEGEYPEVSQNIAVLGTLYNLGHEIRGEGILGYIFGIGNKPRIPHSNPQANPFGLDVEKYYDLMGELLESECIE